MDLHGWKTEIGASANVAQRALYGAGFATRGRGNRPECEDMTQAEVARELGVSERAIRKGARILRHGTSEIIEQVRTGRLALELADRRVQGHVVKHPTLSGLVVALREAIDRLPDCCEREGFTYVLAADEMVKIGHAGDIHRRLIDIQYMNPKPLEILALVRGEDFELDLHRRFNADRQHGEWFADAKVRAWILSAGVCLRCG